MNDSKPVCGEFVCHFIAGVSWYTCGDQPGHDGPHRAGGICFKHGPYLGGPGAPPQCQKWPECVAAPLSTPAQPYKGPIDLPCSACSAGDMAMEHHDHDYVPVEKRRERRVQGERRKGRERKFSNVFQGDCWFPPNDGNQYTPQADRRKADRRAAPTRPTPVGDVSGFSGYVSVPPPTKLRAAPVSTGEGAREWLRVECIDGNWEVFVASDYPLPKVRLYVSDSQRNAEQVRDVLEKHFTQHRDAYADSRTAELEGQLAALRRGGTR